MMRRGLITLEPGLSKSKVSVNKKKLIEYSSTDKRIPLTIEQHILDTNAGK
jgi:hypothetical protein